MFGRYSHFAPPENNKKPFVSGVFRRYKIEAFATNGLNWMINIIFLVVNTHIQMTEPS